MVTLALTSTRHQAIIIDNTAPMGRVTLLARHAAALVVAALPSVVTLDQLQSEIWVKELWDTILRLHAREDVVMCETEAKQEEIRVSGL